jgi:PAS domain S-box-containing protein
MFNIDSKGLVLKFTISGVLLGLLTAVIVLVVDIQSKDLSFTCSGIAEAHKASPSLWVLDFFPLILGLIAFGVGSTFYLKINNTSRSIEEELEKSRKVFEFTEKLGTGDTNAEYELQNENDEVGKSLINLRDNLKKNTEEEIKRRKEDSQRNWATEGLAKFAEILRQNNDDIEQLSYNIIINLIEYTGANVGGFFVLNENDSSDKFFELKACFAYDRRKFSDKQVNWGEGLVGAAALDMETIFLTDVPEKYLNITSGMGGTNPRCVLIVPLLVNDQVQGVIEMASFKIFERFEIEFIEKLAESVASTISTVKINIKTTELLKESQNQAEKMAQQEIEMRQNLEELHAAKEEAAKQEELLTNFTNSVNHTLIRAEYSADGILLYANTRFLNKLGYSSSTEVEGRHVSMFVHQKDQEWFNEIWDSLARGGKHFEGDMKHITKQGKDFWSMATYTCVRNRMSGVDKILFLGIDTTEQKRLSLDFEGQIKALDHSNIKAEFFIDGTIINCNDKFLDTYGYSLKDITHRKIYHFIYNKEVSQFRKNWEKIAKGIPFEGQLQIHTKNGEEKWVHGSFSAVKDMYGSVAKIIFIANEITLQKQSEKEIEKSKVRFEKSIENAVDAIISISEDGRIDFFNKAAELFLGYHKDEIIGKNLKMLLPFEHEEKHPNYIKNYLKGSLPKMIGNRNPVKIKHKSGEEITVLIAVSEIKIENENFFTAFIQEASSDIV